MILYQEYSIGSQPAVKASNDCLSIFSCYCCKKIKTPLCNESNITGYEINDTKTSCTTFVLINKLIACLFVCFITKSFLTYSFFHLHLLYQSYLGLCQATCVQSHQRQPMSAGSYNRMRGPGIGC